MPVARSESVEPTLRDYVTLLRRQWPLIAACAVIAALLTVGLTALRSSTYSSTARVLFPNITTRTGTLDLATEIEIAKSDPVRALVKERLGTAAPADVTAVESSRLLRITVESPSAEDAAKVANAYGDAFVEFRGELFLEGLLVVREQLASKISDLEGAAPSTGVEPLSGDQIAQLALASDLLYASSLRGEIGDLQAASDLVGRAIPSSDPALLTEASRFLLQISYEELFEDIDAAVGFVKISGPRVIDRAAPSSGVSGPGAMRIGSIGALLGIVIGVVLALVMPFLSRKVRTSDEVEAVAGGPVVGVALSGSGRGRREVAPAYDRVRTLVQLDREKHGLRTVFVTSARSSGSAATVGVNLAKALARSGVNTTVATSATASHHVADLLKLSANDSVAGVVIESGAGDARTPRAAHAVPGIGGLFVADGATSGGEGFASLGSTSSRSAVEQLARESDLLLFIAPGLLDAPDGLLMARDFDRVLVVVDSGRTDWEDLRELSTLVDDSGASVLGMVLASRGPWSRPQHSSGLAAPRAGNGSTASRPELAVSDDATPAVESVPGDAYGR